ncbi:probable LRR receptor-like serine/threonine-protein kinase At3g47570 [Hibiscus syriacus]|uniref:probable LRR receptor-like serine/threonine-protein kinase At3g47570 n=1 Tax=Hibiscus syriacus TaxID=106335 RepID=UPI0019250E1E|nr:probable LRR receptor-like serine/threonine-protein kinase At3g47570 [Hibiscus syriacus]
MDGHWFLNFPTNSMISKLLSCSLFLFCILCKLDHVESWTSRNETEIQALLAIKARIQVDPYGVFTPLNDSLHFCNWRGVTCGRRHQRVTALYLSSLKLGGDLSPHIANLTFLRVIDLGNNSFHGTSPLLHLSLKQNHLEGNIPSKLGQLSNLKFLQLSLNFSGTVPKQLYNISTISLFSLAGNQLHGQIPPYIGLILSNLEGIYLGGNKFSGPIPTSIVNCSRLIQLDMGLNSLSGTIPKNFGSLQNIQILNLGHNFLESSNDLSFFTSLINCTNLSRLWLSKNSLTGVLLYSIGNLSTNLIQLRINSNYISGMVPKEIGNLVGLEFLGLYENMFTGIIPDSIGKFSELKYFYGYRNGIIGEISYSLGNLTQLIVLSLIDNLFGGEIAASLGNCIRLERLDLSMNRLSGTIPKEAIGIIPSSFRKLRRLQVLDVSHNNLSGLIPEFLAELPLSNLNFLNTSMAKCRPKECLTTSVHSRLLETNHAEGLRHFDCLIALKKL